MKIIPPSAELVWITPNAAQVIEMAARKCYASEGQYDPSRTADFLDRVINQKHHESVMEHASACFDITTDRGVMAELTRHRLASFSVQSTRYCSYNKSKFGSQIEVLEPPDLSSEMRVIWTQAMEASERAYMQMLEFGAQPQIARSVLPNGLATHMRVTANFREWRHIFSLRTDKAAHPQIREAMEMVQDSMAMHVPELFGFEF